MAKIKTIYYVCGLVHSQDRVLLVRPLAYNGRPFTPFFFPGTKIKKGDDEEKVLLDAIKLKYKGEVSIDTYIGESVRIINKTRFVLKAYYCSLIVNFFLPRTKIDYRWASPEEMKRLRFDHNDGDIAERYNIFKVVYDGELQAGGRSLKETGELNFYLDSFEYFARLIAAKDVQDFNALMRTKASIEHLRKAYKYVMRLNQLDYNVYLDHYEKTHRPDKKDLVRLTTDELNIPDKKAASEKMVDGDIVESDAEAYKLRDTLSDSRPHKLLPAQIVGIVILSVSVVIEIVTLIIAVVPLIPDFYSSVAGSLLLVLSSIAFVIGVMLAFYARKEG
ncbi:MAG: hypothetical protein WC282_03250 [Bacilli bacterium]|jgi:hypothetical protein